MMNKYLLVGALAIFSFTASKAQTISSNVSKDSIAVLNKQLDGLKAKQKLVELKIDEGKEEEKLSDLRDKMAKADKATAESAKLNSEYNEKISKGQGDAKELQKIANNAKRDMDRSQSVLKSYNQRHTKLRELKEKIAKEEAKLNSQRPLVNITF
jgi:DNA repair exonuclease SbcCD ATPase subunit